MGEKEYIEQRLDDQIAWYDTKSQWNQRWFKRLRVIEIVCACSIPFILSFVPDKGLLMKVMAGVFGVVVAAISGVFSLYKFEENWLSYRTTCETLRHEKYLYLTGCRPYDGDDAFSLLVQRIEALISKENTEWRHYVKKHEQDGETK
jgi:hypothetical protein